MTTIRITATGGTNFMVSLIDEQGDRESLGHTEYGTLDADGQYVESNAQIIQHVRETFGLDEAIPAEVV